MKRSELSNPLENDGEKVFLKPFTSRLSYFHSKVHIPAIKWTHDLNIAPVEGYTFSYCQSIQNIQKITNTGGCDKYTIKYIGKIDEQNYVIVNSDGHKNCKLTTNSTFFTIQNEMYQNEMNISYDKRNVEIHMYLVE